MNPKVKNWLLGTTATLLALFVFFTVLGRSQEAAMKVTKKNETFGRTITPEEMVEAKKKQAWYEAEKKRKAAEGFAEGKWQCNLKADLQRVEDQATGLTKIKTMIEVRIYSEANDTLFIFYPVDNNYDRVWGYTSDANRKFYDPAKDMADTCIKDFAKGTKPLNYPDGSRKWMSN